MLNPLWNSPVQELISSVMVSSLLLPVFGSLSLLLYFWLPSKGRSITTLGTRWHDFFYTLLDILYICFILSIAFLFLFLGMQTRERAHCARSVFPFIKKKKKKKKLKLDCLGQRMLIFPRNHRSFQPACLQSSLQMQQVSYIGQYLSGSSMSLPGFRNRSLIFFFPPVMTECLVCHS